MSKRKKWLIGIGLGSMLILVFMYVFRFSILLALGNHLIKEKSFDKKMPVILLSGNAFDRANKVEELIKQNKVSHVYCTGANISNDLKAEGILKSEGKVSMDYLHRLQVPDSLLTLIEAGTSTIEESNIMLRYCKEKHISSIAIVSSKFHTRRVCNVFEKKFKQAGIDIYIMGAESSQFKESTWWENENGLIAFVVEYIKLFYYQLKY